MKYLILFVLFFITSCTNKDKIGFKKTLLQKDKVFLFFRGTETKEGIVVKNFNTSNKKISHVGIGFYENDDFVIYHVLNSDKASNLERTTIEGFYTEFKETHYFGVWEILELKKTEKLTSIINGFKKQNIKFDLTFTEKEDNKYYCSEFVIKVLEVLKPNKFKFKRTKKKLEQLHSIYLGRDSIKYYPVDIFINNNGFKKVFEKDIEYQ